MLSCIQSPPTATAYPSALALRAEVAQGETWHRRLLCDGRRRRLDS